MEPTLTNLVVLPVGLGLLGFVEPCSIGSTLVFAKSLEGRSPTSKLAQVGVFAVTRAAFIGVLAYSQWCWRSFSRAPARRLDAATPARPPDVTSPPDSFRRSQEHMEPIFVDLTHVERNDHHFIDGMSFAPPAEQDAFVRAHPDLYARNGGPARLRIVDGRLALGSLDGPGFGVGATMDFASMRPMPPVPREPVGREARVSSRGAGAGPSPKVPASSPGPA
jgi:hypothetical protein